MPETENLTRQIEESLRQVTKAINHYGRSVLSELEVSYPQFNALLTLKEFGSLTMGELCKHMYTACSTATDLADRMEEAGLVARMRDGRDRRVIRVNLLPKGEEIVNAVVLRRQCLLDQVLREYSSEDKRKLLHMMVYLKQQISQADTH